MTLGRAALAAAGLLTLFPALVRGEGRGVRVPNSGSCATLQVSSLASPPWLAGSDAPRDPCFDPAELFGFSDFEPAGASEHFVLYGRSGVPLPPSPLPLLEEALADFVTRGWRAPRGSEAAQIPVLLDSFPEMLGGYAWESPCAEGRADYLVLSLSWLADPERAAPLVAHELFHAVQRAYAEDELGPGLQTSPLRWFVEASAVYEELQVFPERTALAQARAASWSAAPQLALSSLTGQRPYESFLFASALGEIAPQGAQWHRALWEQLQGRTDLSLPAEVTTLLAPYDLRFDDALAEHLSRAATMDHPGLPSLLGPRDLGTAAVVPWSELPGGGEVQADDVLAPEQLGGGYAFFATADSPKPALRVTFEGEIAPGGTPADWYVELRTEGGDPLRLPLDPERVGARMRARARVDGVSSLAGVWLIVSPRGPVETAGWSFRGELVDGEPEVGIAPLPPGCAQAPGPPFASFLLLLLLPQRRRSPRP